MEQQPQLNDHNKQEYPPMHTEETYYLVYKTHLVKCIVFPGVMYGCESWTIKKAEPRRIDSFELWCR